MNIFNLKGKEINSRWKLGKLLNKGGQGVIYEAKDKDGDLYAVKIFNSLKEVNAEKRKRIKNEIKAISRLENSNHIIKIYDNNITNNNAVNAGFSYYVMDFSKYGSLKDNDYYFRDVEASLKLFKQILIGVNEAHSKNIIHRDLKPENILFYPTQKDIVISDFGLGLMKDIEDEDKITKEDEFLGPMFFISPEQYKNPSEVDERSDIYSLGKILYFMLTGKGKTYREQLGDLSVEFEGTNIFIPLIQQNLIEKMVVEDREKRFPGVGEIIDEVNSILEKMETVKTNRFLVQKNDNKRIDIYKLLMTGEERAKYIDDFPKLLDRSMFELEYVAKDLTKKNKKETLKKLYKDLLDKYRRGSTKCAILSVKAFTDNPKELLNLERKYSKYSSPKYYLGRYFNKLRSYSNAHMYINKAIDSESNRDLKSTYIIELIDICRNCNCKIEHSPDKLLQRLVIESSSGDEKIGLYKTIGNHLLESKDKKELGLKFLEAYLNENPDDSEIRFKCAIEYSNINEDGLSLFHYQSYLDLIEDGSDALNNMGVVFGKNDMPIKEMATYKKAFEQGNTLAGSNIANLYLGVGLKDDAYELLKKIIKENDKYDKNVDIVFGRLATSLDSEKETEEKIKKYVPLKNYHNIEYIKQYTSPHKYNFIGYWQINNKVAFEVVNSQGASTIKKFGDSSLELEGKIENDCLEIERMEIKYLDSYSKGVIYLDSDNSGRGYVQDDKGKLLEITIKRIENPEEYLKKEQESNPLLRAMRLRSLQL